MKVNELRAQARVGQYWLDKNDNKIYKVASVGPCECNCCSGSVRFDCFEWSENLPLKDNWVYLWYIKNIEPSYFNEVSEVKEGQIWIINGVLVFIGPNWKDTDGVITVLSDEVIDFSGFPILYQEAL